MMAKWRVGGREVELLRWLLDIAAASARVLHRKWFRAQLNHRKLNPLSTVAETRSSAGSSDLPSLPPPSDQCYPRALSLILLAQPGFHSSFSLFLEPSLSTGRIKFIRWPWQLILMSREKRDRTSKIQIVVRSYEQLIVELNYL